MANFVSKEKPQPASGKYPAKRNDDLSASMPMLLQNNRYLFSISPQDLAQEFAFDPFLFLREEHLKTQSEDELLLFQLLDRKTDTIVARLPFFVDANGLAYSPGKAPFGSVQFNRKLPEDVLAEFLDQVKRYLLQEKKCQTVRIKSYPFAYAPAESAVLTDLLLKQGYRIGHSEINHHILVDESPLSEKTDAESRRRLRKYAELGFIFQEEASGFLPEAFNFLQTCRLEKGYGFSITAEHLSGLFKSFSDSFRIFTVKKNEEITACTITVQINKSVLYNFAMASPMRFNQYSPAVKLVEGVYRVCQLEGITLLDLGTSNLPTGPNFPLISFKKHLGGEPSLKLTFEFKA